MSLLVGSRHPIMPLTELVKDFPTDVQAMLVPAIQRMLNAGHHYVERMDEARSLERDFKRLEHNHEPFVAPETPCRRCALEDEYLRVFGSAGRARALLEGRQS